MIVLAGAADLGRPASAKSDRVKTIANKTARPSQEEVDSCQYACVPEETKHARDSFSRLCRVRTHTNGAGCRTADEMKSAVIDA